MTDKDMTPQLAARIKAGAEGKLWLIEVFYSHGAERKRHTLANQYANEITAFRENVFRIGLTLFEEPGHYIVVNPVNIIQIDVWKQKRYRKIDGI